MVTLVAASSSAEASHYFDLGFPQVSVAGMDNSHVEVVHTVVFHSHKVMDVHTRTFHGDVPF